MNYYCIFCDSLLHKLNYGSDRIIECAICFSKYYSKCRILILDPESIIQIIRFNNLAYEISKDNIDVWLLDDNDWIFNKILTLKNNYNFPISKENLLECQQITRQIILFQ